MTAELSVVFISTGIQHTYVSVGSHICINEWKPLLICTYFVRVKP